MKRLELEKAVSLMPHTTRPSDNFLSTIVVNLACYPHIMVQEEGLTVRTRIYRVTNSKVSRGKRKALQTQRYSSPKAFNI